MLKFGGERALTRHMDEIAVKGHMGLEEANKVIESTTEMVCKEALIVCGSQINPLHEIKPKTVPVRMKTRSLRSRLGQIMHKLYDLEPSSEPEKQLKIDLDLYQMENY